MWHELSETVMGIRLDAIHDNENAFIRATDEFSKLMWKQWRNPLYWSPLIWEASGNGRRTREVLVELKGMFSKVRSVEAEDSYEPVTLGRQGTY